MQKTFELLATDRHSKARRGRLTSAHGEIDTPAFMPVGTQGSVKGVSPRELRELHAAALRLVEETEPQPGPAAADPESQFTAAR